MHSKRESLLSRDCCLSHFRFNGPTLTIWSTQAVAAGGELTICYGPQLGEMPTPVRQDMLQHNYSSSTASLACVLLVLPGVRRVLLVVLVVVRQYKCGRGNVLLLV